MCRKSKWSVKKAFNELSVAIAPGSGHKICHGLYAHLYIYLFFWPGGGGLLEILSGGVPPCSPNPDPISDQIFHTRSQTRPLKSIPVFRPGLWAEIMLSLLR